MSSRKGKSFWQTLPGIITAITGLVVAITGLVAALGDYGIIELFTGKGPTPTADGTMPTEAPTPFPTPTKIDTDIIIPTPAPVTQEPDPDPDTPPTCTEFQIYKGNANPNAVVLAYTTKEFWVQYGNLSEDLMSTSGLEAIWFTRSNQSGDCLREWIKYLTIAHDPHWPTSSGEAGREYHEVWLNSLTPPLVGELANWGAVPDHILITTIDAFFNPESVVVFLCGEDIPADTLSKVAYWHAGTSEKALDGYLELYASNGYEILNTENCQN